VLFSFCELHNSNSDLNEKLKLHDQANLLRG